MLVTAQILYILLIYTFRGRFRTKQKNITASLFQCIWNYLLRKPEKKCIRYFLNRMYQTQTDCVAEKLITENKNPTQVILSVK